MVTLLPMSDIRLLALVETLADKKGYADAHKVATAYGDGFREAVRSAFDNGDLEWQGPLADLKLSSSGRLKVQRGDGIEQGAPGSNEPPP